MLNEMRVVFSLLIVILIAIQTIPINAKDNSVSLFASMDWKKPDHYISVDESSLGQRWLDGSVIDGKIKTTNSFPLSGISSNDLCLKRPGTAIVTITSPIKGYQVFVDNSSIDAEGLTEPLDGQITIRVDGNLNHNIKIVKGSYSRETTSYFKMGDLYVINFDK
jgi:hypothetical protein